jgi:hypothetical protein
MPKKWKHKNWIPVTDPSKLAGLPPEVEDVDGTKHSTIGVMQYPRASFATIFLLAGGLLYWCATILWCVRQFHESIGNVERHLATSDHLGIIGRVQGIIGTGNEFYDRIFNVMCEIAFNMRPFRLIQSPHLAPLINCPFALTGTTARQLVVATGMLVKRSIERRCADESFGPPEERKRLRRQCCVPKMSI